MLPLNSSLGDTYYNKSSKTNDFEGEICPLKEEFSQLFHFLRFYNFLRASNQLPRSYHKKKQTKAKRIRKADKFVGEEYLEEEHQWQCQP